MTYVIQTANVSKDYRGGLRAVDRVSIQIKKGEIYGFIGLNGAGKTTLIRMLLGMIRSTEGTCYIKGEKVTKTNYQIWKDVGYMVETPYAYPELTVQENLDIIRRLRLIENPNDVQQVIDKLKLTPYKQVKAGNLSLGNAQRLGIAKALLHDPDILILDEPMNGLDPAGIVEIRQLLHDLAFNHEVTIFISSHLLSEVAKMSTKIGIIHEGQLIEEIDSDSLHYHLNRHLLVDTNDNSTAISALMKEGYSPVLSEKRLIKVSDEVAINHPDKIAKHLVYQGIPPSLLTIEEEDLEAYFLRVIRSKGENKQ